MKLIDNKPRSVLSEGRNKGMGFALCKRDGDTYTTVQPVSPCKDYLNDVVYSERTGKPYQAWGLKTKKEDIFSGDRGYMVISICGEGASRPRPYGEFESDKKRLNDGLGLIQGFINSIEKLLKIENLTVMTKIEDNLVMVDFPLFWSEGTYLISLFSLLLRIAIKYNKGDPLEFMSKVNDEDSYMAANALAKLKRMIGGCVPKQDLSKLTSGVHDLGIYSFNFPNE
jgi:hypothetical protein